MKKLILLRTIYMRVISIVVYIATESSVRFANASLPVGMRVCLGLVEKVHIQVLAEHFMDYRQSPALFSTTTMDLGHTDFIYRQMSGCLLNSYNSESTRSDRSHRKETTSCQLDFLTFL